MQPGKWRFYEMFAECLDNRIKIFILVTMTCPMPKSAQNASSVTENEFTIVEITIDELTH